MAVAKNEWVSRSDFTVEIDGLDVPGMCLGYHATQPSP